MAKYCQVDQRVWSDERFVRLSDDGRLLWLYLLTSPAQRYLPGVIHASKAVLAEDLQWSVERFDESFNELLANGFRIRFDFACKIVWLENSLKYQKPHNPNAVKAWAKQWAELPRVEWIRELWQSLQAAVTDTGKFSELFDKLFKEPLTEPLGEPLGERQGVTITVTSNRESTAASLPSTPTPKPRKQPEGPHAEAIAAYMAGYETKYGEKPQFTGKVDGPIVARLLKSHGPEAFRRKLAIAFEQTPEWPPDPWDLRQIEAHWNKLIGSDVAPKQPKRQAFGPVPVDYAAIGTPGVRAL